MRRISWFSLMLLFSDRLFAASGHKPENPLPLDLSSYPESTGDLWTDLVTRAGMDPLNLISACLFVAAILHTFMAPKLLDISHKIQDAYTKKRVEQGIVGKDHADVSFLSQVFHFLGELEVVFLIWTVPLFWSIVSLRGWSDAVYYTSHKVNYTEPMFVVIIMIIASTRPILNFSENCLRLLAKIGKETTAAWWFALLIFTPILGSFITEPAAMTIAALLLSRKFFRLKPSLTFKYGTIGLLFVNISVGGTLTHFAAPPVLMVAAPWGWDTAFMMSHFGWKAFIGIVISTILYGLYFRKEFNACDNYEASNEMNEVEVTSDDQSDLVPFWVVAIHIFALAWTVTHAHNPPLFVIGFTFFLGFMTATQQHQNRLDVKSPILVGIFLAGLVTHGGLQGWWIAPVLQSMGEFSLLVTSIVLTAFNDNAAITYLSTLVPDFADAFKYAVVAGAVTGGGLTVIANAPNPAGQSILSRFFPNKTVSPLNLAAGAIIPTLIMACCFWFL